MWAWLTVSKQGRHEARVSQYSPAQSPICLHTSSTFSVHISTQGWRGGLLGPGSRSRRKRDPEGAHPTLGGRHGHIVLCPSLPQCLPSTGQYPAAPRLTLPLLLSTPGVTLDACEVFNLHLEGVWHHPSRTTVRAQATPQR